MDNNGTVAISIITASICTGNSYATETGCVSCACNPGFYAVGCGGISRGVCKKCIDGLWDDYCYDWTNEGECTFKCKMGCYNTGTAILRTACALCDEYAYLCQGAYYYVPCIKDSAIEATKDGTCEYCNNAPANYYYYTASSGTWNVSDCGFACKPGYYASGKECVPCKDGSVSFAASTSIQDCKLCPFAKYIQQADFEGIGPLDGIAACKYCENGKITKEDGAPCTACGLGSRAYANKCYACSAGKFASFETARDCLDCGAGTFAPLRNASTCMKCAVGTYTAGITSIKCTNCTAGTFSAVEASTQCTNCPARTFSANEGSVQCIACPAGTFASSESSTECTACLAGSYSEASSTVCTLCTAGKYAAASGRGKCEDCIQNSYTTALGSTQCTLCNATLCDKGEYKRGCGGAEAGGCTGCTNTE
jgi:hypothetical protein